MNLCGIRDEKIIRQSFSNARIRVGLVGHSYVPVITPSLLWFVWWARVFKCYSYGNLMHEVELLLFFNLTITYVVLLTSSSFDFWWTQPLSHIPHSHIFGSIRFGTWRGECLLVLSLKVLRKSATKPQIKHKVLMTELLIPSWVWEHWRRKVKWSAIYGIDWN